MAGAQRSGVAQHLDSTSGSAFKVWGATLVTFLFAAANMPMLLRHGLDDGKMRQRSSRDAGRMSESDPFDPRADQGNMPAGVKALEAVDLDIRKGEIFALLGPNGAGKTTLINIICGIVTPSGGEVLVEGQQLADRLSRRARTRIGLVPQELTTDAFETVWRTVSFSRGLFGKPRDPQADRGRCSSACRCGTSARR